MAKSKNERQILRNFLLGDSLAGTSRISEIITGGQNEVDQDENLFTLKPQALVFYLEQLKQTGVYEKMVLRLISSDSSFRSATIASQILTGKSPELPNFFPSDHKKADSIMVGAISSAVGIKECRNYLLIKLVLSRIREIAKDLFLVTNYGLSKYNTTRFMAIFYELEKLKTADSVRYREMKNEVARVVMSGDCIQLTHVKCLRFIYPKAGGFKILTDTKNIVTDGVLGKYSPKSEERLFPRLMNIREVFERNGVKTRFLIILADEDIDLLFPEESRFTNKADREEAIENMEKYLEFLKTNFTDFEFATLKGLTILNSGSYRKLRQQVIDDLRLGLGRFMSSEFYEKDRVDHQYTYYQRLLGLNYSRQEARRSVSEQVASMIALRELLTDNGGKTILIEENREGKNRLIAGGKYPIFFTKLRDEAKFDLT